MIDELAGRLAAVAVLVRTAAATSRSVACAGVPPAAGCCCAGDRVAAESREAHSPSVISWVRDPTAAGAGAERPCRRRPASRGRPGNPLFDRTEAIRKPSIPADITLDGREYRYWYRTVRRHVPGRVGSRVHRRRISFRPSTAEMRARIPRPTVSLSPDAGVGGFVALQTWLGVAPIAPVSATAGPTFGGLTVTATAVPEPHRVDARRSRGGHDPLRAVGRDTSRRCAERKRAVRLDAAAPVGRPVRRRRRRELPRHRSPIVWTASWTASTGESGALDTIETTTAVTYRVREIQTIGEDR